MASEEKQPLFERRSTYVVLTLLVAIAAAGVTALLTDIFQKKVEQRNPYVRVVEVDKRGQLHIKGTKTVDVDKNKQKLEFSGWVRPEDISKDNIVASERVLA